MKADNGSNGAGQSGAPGGAATSEAPASSTKSATKPPGRGLPSSALLAAGKALRDRVPHSSQGPWKRDKAKVDALAILSASDEGRLAQLIPIRYGRMLQSPFTFYRGSAAVMAAEIGRAHV